MSRLWPRRLVPFLVGMTMLLGGCGSSPPPSPPISLSLSAPSPQAIDQGQTIGITAAVTNDMSSSGVTWKLSGLGSLSNPTELSVTYNSPTTNLTSAQEVTVSATSLADPTKTASLQITVNPYPQIPLFQMLANGTVGTAYSQTIALTGGTAPFQWSVYNGPILTGANVGGAVPDGLKLDPNTGTVSGTPTAAGTWYFEATATDEAGEFAFNALSIQINPSAPAGNPVPFLDQSLAPTAVSPGSPGFTLSLSGAGFVSGATVELNSTPLGTTFLDSDHLTAAVPAAQLASPATLAVMVVNPAPGGGRSNLVYLDVGAPETTVTFANAPNSPLQVSEAIGIAAGDFNEDGKPDLVIAGNIRVYVLLGNGDGTFTPAAESPMLVPSPPYNDLASPRTGPAIATGDFNHSGHLGLAVGEPENEAAVILLGHGDGTFAPSSATFANASSIPTGDLQAADFNADGNLDLAIMNNFLGSFVVLGYGSGAFTTAGNLYAGTLSAGEVVGDFNADGELDAIVARGGTAVYPSSGVSVSLGNGAGTFTQANGSPISLGNDLSAIATADFNGDGKLDLAVTDYGGNSVMILPGNGDGTFGTPTTIPVGNQPYAIVTGDFNNDGKLDLAIANYGDGTITLLLGNGDGTFTEASGSPYPVGGGPYRIAAADFNGDGKLDLAVVNVTDGTVSILLQQ